MDADLELSRAVGFQVLSHGSSRSCSDISDIVCFNAGPTVSGGEKCVQPVAQTGFWFRVHQGHRACRDELSPTSEEMKSYFNWYHVLLLRPESRNKPMIPANGLRHAPTGGMLNHLIWFLESAVDEDQDEQCHYSSGASFFIQGAISMREKITVVGDARWEQSTEHCRAFSSIAMQLLHDLGANFHLWIIIGPATCVGNRGLKEYVLIRPMTTMRKAVNVTILYAEWLKEVKNYLTTHLRRVGDTTPPYF
jgi:hypothetical protein